MAKKTINGVNVGLVGASTTNYIKQISDGKINHHRLNLMSNPRRVEGPPIIYIQPTKGFPMEERSEHDCDFNRKIPTGGGGMA